MDTNWNEIVWRQFGAAIDMLENAVNACPEPLWNDRAQRPEFWHVAYHALFFLDLLQHARRKCQTVLAALSAEQARRHCVFDWLEMSFAELLLHNLRHVQHHAGQLNLLRRQATNAALAQVLERGRRSLPFESVH